MIQSFQLDLNWSLQDNRVIVPILLALICFMIYWFVAQSITIKNRFYRTFGEDLGSAKHIFFTKIVGFVVMGVVPVVISLFFINDLNLETIGLTFYTNTALFTLLWTVGLCILVVPIAAFSAKKPKNLLNYPQIRTKNWTKSIYFQNLLGWALYLIGYEILFRGVLFMPLVEPLGIWPAIAINVALYAATHIPKGMDETIGAIPLGLVLCLLTAASGTLWIAIIVHIAMAWTNSLFALKNHPEIHYQK